MALRRGTRLVLTAVALAVVVMVAAGCGRDDFENDPRPPVPLEATVEVTDRAVQISPPAFGAGIVNFSIANTTDKEVVFTLDGPTDGESAPIEPRNNTVLKIAMEQGTYDAAIKGNDFIEPTEIKVGPLRESSQDDLLLP